MKVWVAMKIGCLECGNPSDLIGVYAMREDAVHAIDKLSGEDGWNRRKWMNDGPMGDWWGSYQYVLYESEVKTPEEWGIPKLRDAWMEH